MSEKNDFLISEELREEVRASRAFMRVAKHCIRLDLLTHAGEEVEKAFVAYDKALGLLPHEVRQDT